MSSPTANNGEVISVTMSAHFHKKTLFSLRFSLLGIVVLIILL